jgi:hypothetical protein
MSGDHQVNDYPLFCTDLALLLLLILMLRRTKRNAEPAIHIHPCITISSEAAAKNTQQAIKDSIDQIGRESFK